MNSSQIKKMTIEACVLLLISFALLFVGNAMTSTQSDTRVQNGYSEMFSDVLEADRYREIFPDNLSDYEGINHVYQAFDATGEPVGFVLDVSVEAAGNTSLHLLTGVTYDGAELTGIKHIADETNPAPVSEDEIVRLASQATGSQIPISYAASNNSDDDGDGSVTMISGLHDGIYYAQKLNMDSNGYIDYVQIEVNGGFITRVNWDAFNIDRTTKGRIEASLSGAFSVSGDNWANQSYNLCHALINCQDPSRLAMKSDGTTDIVAGVTIEIRDFVELAYECIDNSICNYNQETYIEDLKNIIFELTGTDPEAAGLINDEGYVVFSFDDYPSVFEQLDEEGNVIGSLNVRQKTTEDLSDVDFATIQVDEDQSNPSVYSVTVIGAEDGVSIGGGYDVTFENIDGLPASEIRSYIPGIPGARQRTRCVLSAINLSYRFLKDYLDWMA